jgi:predicted NBD/HSP70 family sugar kinase
MSSVLVDAPAAPADTAASGGIGGPSGHGRRVGASARRASPVERLRIRHLGEVLRSLRDQGAQSRTDLCDALGLSSTTLSKLVTELLSGGWVTEGAVRRQRDVGRPHTVLALAPQACRLASVVVEPDALHVGVAGLDARLGPVDSTRERFTQQPVETSVDRISRAIHDVQRAERAAGRPPLRAVSVTLPGLTDTRLRTLLRSDQLGWHDVALADALESRTGLPVRVHNNTRAMAFAEFRHLGLDEEQPMLFVQARFGLGAAMVNSARASRHGHFGASDLGHLPLGVNAFASRVPSDGRLVSVTHEAYLCAVLGVPAGAEPVLPTLEARRAAGDATAKQLYDQTLDNLATGLGIAVDILCPRTIVLGGIYALASEGFAQDLKARLTGRAQAELLQGLSVRRSALGLQGALQGAALVGLDHLLADPATFRGA